MFDLHAWIKCHVWKVVILFIRRFPGINLEAPFGIFSHAIFYSNITSHNPFSPTSALSSLQMMKPRETERGNIFYKKYCRFSTDFLSFFFFFTIFSWKVIFFFSWKFILGFQAFYWKALCFNFNPLNVRMAFRWDVYIYFLKKHRDESKEDPALSNTSVSVQKFLITFPSLLNHSWIILFMSKF